MGLNTKRSDWSTSMIWGRLPAGQVSESNLSAAYKPPNPPPTMQILGLLSSGHGTNRGTAEAEEFSRGGVCDEEGEVGLERGGVSKLPAAAEMLCVLLSVFLRSF